LNKFVKEYVEDNENFPDEYAYCACLRRDQKTLKVGRSKAPERRVNGFVVCEKCDLLTNILYYPGLEEGLLDYFGQVFENLRGEWFYAASHQKENIEDIVTWIFCEFNKKREQQIKSFLHDLGVRGNKESGFYFEGG